jgi:hypothetical protein
MRTHEAQRHIAAIAPLVQAGLVPRDGANAAIAFWDSIGWKNGKIAAGKWFPESTVKTAIPVEMPIIKPKKAVKADSKPVYHSDIIENSLFTEAKEKREKWVPQVDEIY